MALRARILSGDDPEVKSWEDAEQLGYCLKKQAVRPKRFPVNGA
jgi:hypothetical protein